MRVDAGALRMSVHRDARGGEDVLIELAGELDAPGRRCLRDQIAELLGRGGATVTVDVGGLRRVDIPGLAALLRADLLLRRVRGSLEIRSATPAFLELVTATGLTGRLRLVPAPPSPRPPAATAARSAREEATLPAGAALSLAADAGAALAPGAQVARPEGVGAAVGGPDPGSASGVGG
ncbi:hypothetical protein FraEuI1c_7133 [Pseudofrankia inefficax]|uniref:STAS domain-containing protein n=1 Tax=Pseudofrankia inefficax (strain DSM 45817 / CECT 9037 / DDB 130130 / EuI1c) TaxID=298654 RepID=E3IYM7_PSEI1|nr:hypothetical protein FraEuI1c_7133 [Pseudofrankia inefficax]